MKIHSSGFRLVAALAVLFGCFVLAGAQAGGSNSLDESPLPKPTEPVNDFAGVLSEATKQSLNQRIKEFKAKTNPPVVLAVAVVRTTGGRPIEEYSLAVYRGWKIGTMNDDNPGALLFIAIDDRKYFTQVGRDLEDELPDGVVGQLQRQYLVPALKQGDYNKGVTDTIDAYMRTIEQRAGTTSTQPTQPTSEKSSAPLVSLDRIICCTIILVIILIIIFSRGGGSGRRGRDRWGGGGSGGGGGWIFLPGGGFGGGSSSSSWGGSSDWGGSGGSSDWGGFGGGGDAGGGGAGGDW